MSEHHVSPFVGDGYDLEYVIKAAAGRWPDVRIRYRPLSADEESGIFAKKNLDPTLPIVRLYAEVFAGKPAKLLGWDLKDREGQSVAITADNLCKLSPQFFDTLKAVIDGSVVTETTTAEEAVKN